MDSFRRLRASLRAFADTRWALGLETRFSIAAVKFWRAATRTPPQQQLIVLAPPGAGNIGDQAMVRTLVHHQEGGRLLVVSSGSADAYGELGVPIIHLPELINGGGFAHWADMLRFARVVSGASAFSIVGADMMDGGYGRVGAIRRWGLARAAAASGKSTRVLGFSWNDAPSQDVVAAAREAGYAGVVSLVRDPLSVHRALTARLPWLVECRDMVFAHQFSQDEGSATDLCHDTAVVNLSGLIGATTDQIPGYIAIVNHLLNRGLRVVLLPHVLHMPSDDLVEARKLFRNYQDDERVSLVEQQLRPDAVQRMTRQARVVVAGRMHLAILALSGGTPTVVLSTQGKVEGLLLAMGIPQGCILPGPGFQIPAIHAIDSFLEAGHELREQIVRNASEARQLALRNFMSTDSLEGLRRT